MQLTLSFKGRKIESECSFWRTETEVRVHKPFIARFRSGSKNHVVHPFANLCNGVWVIEESTVVHNRTIPIVGEAKIGDGSGWTLDVNA